MSISVRINGSHVDLEWMGDVAKPVTAYNQITNWLWNRGISYAPSMFIDENTLPESMKAEEFGEKFEMCDDGFGHIHYIRWQFDVTTDKIAIAEEYIRLRKRLHAA